MSVLTPTSEQLQIVKEINNSNVVIDCVAGSGKSFSALLIAKAYSQKKILLLTYNKRLKLETRQRMTKDHENLEVHSFHSYSVNYYDKESYTDSVLAKVVKTDSKTTNKTVYDIVIVDEAQDLTILYLGLVKKVLKDSSAKDSKICVLGDQKQSIYVYNGSDQRFLKYIDKILRPDTKWTHLKLTETFRLTKSMTEFLNCITCSNNTVSSSKIMKIVTKKKEYGQIRHVTTNCFKQGGGPFKELEYYLSKGLKYVDIMVIAPSLKKGPVSTLSNKLTSMGIPVHYPTSDSEEIDDSLTKNKILFCTMHQSKGLERKAIILFNFDESYFMYNKDADPFSLSNELYVALTRSSMYISLIRHSTSKNLEFVEEKLDQLISNGIVIPIEYEKYKKTVKKDFVSGSEIKIPVTNVVKYVTHDIIDNILECLTLKELVRPGLELNLVTKVYQEHQDLYEQVSDISGTAIPAYYEYIKTGRTTIIEMEKSQKSGRKFKDFNFSEKATGYSKNGQYSAAVNKINNSTVASDIFLADSDDEVEDYKDSKNNNNNDNNDLENYDLKKEKQNKMKNFQKILYVANKFLAISSGVDAKMQQIENYNWISEEVLDTCMDRLSKVMSADTEYEVESCGTLFKKDLAGYMDAIDHENKAIVEFKCTQNIEKEHIVQVLLYKLLNEQASNYSSYVYKIFNIRTGQIIQIDIKKDIDREQLNNAIKALITYKNIRTQNDEDFLKSALAVYKQ